MEEFNCSRCGYDTEEVEEGILQCTDTFCGKRYVVSEVATGLYVIIDEE